MKRKEIIINGIKLNFYESGLGKYLLFLHGGRLRALIFKKTLKELSKNYHIIAPDIPGYGDSSTPKEVWTFKDYANFFILFIEYLKIKEVIVVGYSLGGGIVYNMTSISEKVKKLVLINSAGIEKTSGSQIKRDFDRFLFYLIHPRYFSTFLILLKEWLLFTLKHLLNFNHIKSIRKGLNNSYGYLDNIKIPTSIIWAKDDKIFSVETAKKLQKTIKKSQIVVVNGNHDWVLYDENKFMKYLNRALI
ncbi:MAG: alpha/beta hydrolase [bacterium]|nr:alpha/beta hydrolase [bacterium]